MPSSRHCDSHEDRLMSMLVPHTTNFKAIELVKLTNVEEQGEALGFSSTYVVQVHGMGQHRPT